MPRPARHATRRILSSVNTYLKHPALANEGRWHEALPDLLKDSFCGRFDGHPEDEHSDAGTVRGIIETALGLRPPKPKDEEADDE